ncbi:hypothetical protein B0I37DRAFT_390734 [Chaetomium sp. MPI-CAGE-AT-0009]|nr:hypothetical protein B0I37DRAFT_390734 [Chaetomium sp. MPI-CAGE-AT-0009]
MKLLWMFLSCAPSVHALGVGTCCAQLYRELGIKVSFPGQPIYNATRDSYWSLQESGLNPGCVVRPSVPQDVARAVSIISGIYSCNFAIKGQGHAPAASFANIDGGVTIDMTGLNTTALSPDRSVVKVGAGAAWLQVYQYLDPFNISVAGGRNGAVGVGGLTLGGGISHFSPRVGWACDNVVNFEVVLVNGTLTNANGTHHSDLYRALKGGANNFGVVTRFDLATFPQGDISALSLANGISQRGHVFEAFTDILSSPEFDIYTSLVTGFRYNSTSKSWAISNSAVYTRPVLHPPVFAGLAAVPSVSNNSRITSLASFADEAPTPPLNWLFGTVTLKPSTEFMLEVFDILNNTLYSINPPVAYYIILLSALWPDSAANPAAEQASRRAILSIESRAKAKGLLRNFQYLNYAASYQAPLTSYGARELEFLKGVSSKYDRLGLFQSRVPGGFKLY